MRIKNRRARYNYKLFDRYEAGIVLTGPEVKSIKENTISLEDSFVRIKNNEAFLINAFIPAYKHADRTDYRPRRTRKLLLHKKELISLQSKMKQGSFVLVPISCYTKKGRIKIEIALARGKKKYDKRRQIKEREQQREINRILKNSRRA